MLKTGTRSLLGILLLPTVATTAPPVVPDHPTEQVGGDTPAELAASLRGILLEFLPAPLYEDHKHWGGQKEVTRGLKWKVEDHDLHVERQRSLKNDGLWWRVKVTAADAASALIFEVRNVQKPEPGKMTFTAFISCNTDIEYERQRWDAGRRLFSTSIRGRARMNLMLNCESSVRAEDKKHWLPDVVYRLRVTSSDFRYDNVVFEHVAGVGGDAAKVIGDIALDSLRLWRPSLEQRLLDRANRAIVKAGDTKEVRVGLGKLFAKSK